MTFDRSAESAMFSESGSSSDWVRVTAKFCFALFACEAIFSVCYRSVYLVRHSASLSFFAGAFVLAIVFAGGLVRTPLLASLGRVSQLPLISDRKWFGFWLLVGIALRLVWILRFPVPLMSDHLAYFQGAAEMSQGHTGLGAFWPPGFSLFLAPFFMALGTHIWVAHVCAILLFIAGYVLTYHLALEFGGQPISRIATPLVSVWPGYFTVAAINCKEAFLLVLVTASMLCYLKATSLMRADRDVRRVRWSMLFVSGACMGAAALTQPAFMLFPGVIALVELLARHGLVRTFVRTVVFSVAVILVILPWTYRNYTIFHRLVLISTNGGSVLYRANNPLANAAYAAEGETVLPKDDFDADKVGYKLAENWIAQHPFAFAGLAVRKQVVFLGDDALGPYESLKRGHDESSHLYTASKGVSNLFWLLLWVILLYGTPVLFRLRRWQSWFGVLFLPLVYQWAIDSIFESGSRHHVPFLGLLSILVALVLTHSNTGFGQGTEDHLGSLQEHTAATRS